MPMKTAANKLRLRTLLTGCQRLKRGSLYGAAVIISAVARPDHSRRDIGSFGGLDSAALFASAGVGWRPRGGDMAFPPMAGLPRDDAMDHSESSLPCRC